MIKRSVSNHRATAGLCSLLALALPVLAQDTPPAPPEVAPEAPAVVEPPLPSPGLPQSQTPVPDAAAIPAAIPTEQLQTVKSIDVRNVGSGGSIDKNRVLSNMALRVGGTYSQEKSDADVKNLMSSGDVANVNILAEPTSGNGVKVIVMVEPRTSLGEVLFLGNAAVSKDVLDDAAQEAGLTTGKMMDESTIRAAQIKIEETYQKKGFPDVRITYRQEKAADTGFTRVTFTIDEGARAILDEVEFAGNTALTASELKKVVKIGSRDWWRVWDLSKRVSNEQLDADVKAIQLKYQDAGYMNAKVVGVDRVPSGDKTNIVFRIQEGAKYDVTAVGIDGMANYPNSDLLPSLQLEANGPYSATAIKEDIRTIRDYYGSRGFADVNVNPRIVSSGPQQLAVTYSVSEGKKSFIRKINIDGNTKTKDEVIRRELAMVPGEEYSMAKMELSKKRLENLGYFGTPGTADSGVEFFPAETEQAGYKDVNITVRERSTGSINFGAGFSSIDSVVGFIDLTQTNFDLFNWPSFTGAGQRFRLGLKYGTKRKDAMLEITEPWFLDQRLALGGELYYRDLNYLSDVYDQTNIGAAVSLRKPIGEHAYLKGEYRLQQVEIDVDEKEASPLIQQEEGDYLQSQLALTYVYDTRDSIFLPRKGNKVTFGGTYSGSFLGGDVDTYSLSASAIQYFHLPFDTVFSIEGNIDVVDNHGGDRVPIFERQFLGGATNLRGFDYRDVGPKDGEGEPLGGKTAAYVTAQYNFPIMEKVRGVVFADLGVVSPDSFDFSGDVNSDVGFGLHLYFLPQGPLRLEFGIPISSDEFNDSGGKFNFNIGYQF